MNERFIQFHWKTEMVKSLKWKLVRSNTSALSLSAVNGPNAQGSIYRGVDRWSLRVPACEHGDVAGDGSCPHSAPRYWNLNLRKLHSIKAPSLLASFEHRSPLRQLHQVKIGSNSPSLTAPDSLVRLNGTNHAPNSGAHRSGSRFNSFALAPRAIRFRLFTSGSKLSLSLRCFLCQGSNNFL